MLASAPLLANDAWAEAGATKTTAAKSHRPVVPPLSHAQRALLHAIRPDPPPKKLIGGQHFYVSDEARPDKFRHVLQPAGGIYIGVGPEQNYLYAGWARPEIMVLLDFDQVVVDIHQIYCCFFAASNNVDDMLRLWSKHSGGYDIIRTQVPNPTRQAQLRSVYYGSRRAIAARLRALQQRYRRSAVGTFLTDVKHYGYLRDMVRAGRVFAVRGDFTKSKTMNDIAKAAKLLKLPIRCLYLSNVEQYFGYNSGIGHNISVQPTTDESVILRTMTTKNDKAMNRYSHYVQRYDDFRAWLNTDVVDVQTMVRTAHTRIDKSKAAWVLPGPA